MKVISTTGVKQSSLYHPSTHILIEALQKMPGGAAVLARWDADRRRVDAASGVAVPAAPPHPCRFFNGKCIDCGRSWGAPRGVKGTSKEQSNG